MRDYDLIFATESYLKAGHSLHSLKRNGRLGKKLNKMLAGEDPEQFSALQFIHTLLKTKNPQIFAESAVDGDGSDWTLEELSILGDLSIGMEVTVFDNGRHHNPLVHDPPFPATLIFTPGALLRNDRGGLPADWEEVVSSGEIDNNAFYGLYERRLLSALVYANDLLARKEKFGLVTIPGLGCGAFAGDFHGSMGENLRQALGRLLRTHRQRFPKIRMLYFDPYSECENDTMDIGGLQYRVRPLTKGNQGKSQLSRPAAFEEPGDDFSDLHLISFVAWDHVSWPGNDYFGGFRQTDDGVKAAATDSMARLTGVEGRYDPVRFQYLPPKPYTTWGDLVEDRRILLNPGRTWVEDRFI